MGLRSPRLRQLGRVDGKTIYLVDGEKVRDDIDVDFVNGGNDAVYHYIPADEIWIDDAQHELDRTATSLHELVERDLMHNHGLTYDHAHDRANGYERAFRKQLVRHNPKAFDLRSLTLAYQDYLRHAGSHKTSRQLDQEIASVFGKKANV